MPLLLKLQPDSFYKKKKVTIQLLQKLLSKCAQNLVEHRKYIICCFFFAQVDISIELKFICYYRWCPRIPLGGVMTIGFDVSKDTQSKNTSYG